VADLDHALQRLGDMPLPAGLTAIDNAVFAGLERRRQELFVSRRLMAGTAAVSLVIGVAGGGMIGSVEATARPLSPFASDSPLAPSTLLDVHP
jgi:hypothetical protein